MDTSDHDRRPRPRRGETRLWRQALGGIGLVTLAGLIALGVGAVMALVVSWLF